LSIKERNSLRVLVTNSGYTVRLGCRFTEILSFNGIKVIFKIWSTWVLMHWTSVRPIVFQGIVWRCSFVPANDLADSQVGKAAGSQCILWHSCIGLLLEPIALPVARCGTIPWQPCIGLLFSQSHLAWASGEVKTPQLLYSSETITLSI
jgi:hypothetical protein